MFHKLWHINIQFWEHLTQLQVLQQYNVWYLLITKVVQSISRLSEIVCRKIEHYLPPEIITNNYTY